MKIYARSLATTFACAAAVVLLALLSAAVWAAADSPPAPDGPAGRVSVASGGVLRFYGVEPTVLDPALVTAVSDIRTVAQIFEGLVRVDDNLQPQPALAAGWTFSPDASVYTFTLDTAYFSNGRQVVADDVVNSIMRAISPTINGGGPADYAGILFDIEGAQEYNEGDLGASVGVHALDTATVRFDLVGTVPPGAFLKKLAVWIASVVPLEEIEAGGPEWWRDPEHLVGSGPFKMTEWVAGDHLYAVPNPLYSGDPPPVRRLEVHYLADTAAALAAYRANEIDVFEPDATQLVTITADPILATELMTMPGVCTFWSNLDNQKEPFSGTLGMKLRQAVNYAIDKADFIGAVMPGGWIPARGYLPAGSYGYNPALEGLDFNVVSATQRLAESGYSGSPPIVFRYAATPVGQRRAENVRDQLLDNLGITIVLSTTAADYQMSLQGWCLDYPDPENLLPYMVHSSGHFNRTHYSNPAVDALLDLARITLDEGQRIELYRQAEQMAVSEASVLPLYHNLALALKKPWVSEQVLLDMTWYQPLNDVSLAVGHVYLPLVIRGQ